MTQVERRYAPSVLVARAAEKNIRLYVEGNDLLLVGPEIPEAAVDVMKSHKSEVLAYISNHCCSVCGVYDPTQTGEFFCNDCAGGELCATCFEAGADTPAVYYDPETQCNYCDLHGPNRKPEEHPTVKAMLDIFGGSVTVYPPGTDTKAIWRAEQQAQPAQQHTHTPQRPKGSEECASDAVHPSNPIRHSLKKNAAVAEAHFEGFYDALGNWWCGHCFARATLMDLGMELNFPDIRTIYPNIDRPEQGQESWLQAAKTESDVVVGQLVDIVKKSKH